jgi:farnesyl-diphosphate farnesyltransferase
LILKPALNQPISSNRGDFEYQTQILPGVSRTFAITIPVLPDPLSVVVANAYLLCRLADTIEDDVALDQDQKSEFHQLLISVVEGNYDANIFARQLSPLLSLEILPDERNLVENTARIVRVTHSFSVREQEALTRCIRVMCSGMSQFQRNKSLTGFKDMGQLQEYCYVVAGVVGEMLTELFCVYCADLEKKRDKMMKLAVSFGQALQMTNILKDMWDDRQRGACWLPRSIFFGGSLEFDKLDQFRDTQAFRDGMEELIRVAYRHMQQGLEYTCEIPTQEVGMRRFCSWALGLAVLTLQKIHANPTYTSASQVKISRKAVKATVFTTNLFIGNNRVLRLLFNLSAARLPLVDRDVD